MPVDKDDAVPVGVAVGRAIRSLREAHGLRQEDLAERAAEFGLRWDRTVIARLEAGKRHVGVEELLLLALMFKVPPGDLFPADDFVVLSPAIMIRAGLLRDVFAGRRFPETSVDLETAVSAAPGEMADVGGIPGVTVLPDGTSEMLDRAATRDAERKAAKLLGVHPYEVSLAAFRLWGRSLSDQRDLEVDAEAGGRSLRARRGHVTRRLVGDIAAEIAKSKPSTRRRKS